MKRPVRHLIQDSPLCTSYIRPQNQSDTVGSQSNPAQAAVEAPPTCARTGHHGDNHMNYRGRMRWYIIQYSRVVIYWVYMYIQYSLQVAAQFLLTAAGPVEPVESSLHQWGHDAPHLHLISTTVPLPIMLHSQPITQTYIQVLVI